MIEDWVIIGCIKNQETAQRELYLSCGPVVKSICLRYISGEEALDVFHDCFLKIMGAVDKYNNQGSFEGWVKRIAVNFCLDYLRKVSKIKFVETPLDLQEEEPEEIDSEEIDAVAVQNIGYTQTELVTMLQELPEKYKVVFSLFQIEKYSHKEIADLLKISESASRSRLERAKSKLKSVLIEKTKERLNQ